MHRLNDRHSDRRVTPPPAHYNDLDAVEAAAWAMLAKGVADRRHTYHTPALATVSDNGPEVRTVVLRAADPDIRTVRFHTDTRSAKVSELQACPRAALHFYDPRAKIQVRLSGTATIHTDDALAERAWAETTVFAKRCYLEDPGPGTESRVPTSGFPDAFRLNEQTEEDVVAGRPYFCAVQIVVDRLEWLYLAYIGHRRARIDWDQEGTARRRWLVP